MKNIIFTALIVFQSAFLMAQEIGIGQWRDHLPYRDGQKIAVADEGVYCATPYSLFFYDTEDMSIERLSKINGLSENFISTIRYNSFNKTLFIAYQDANIDMITPNGIVNIPDIKRYPILGNKTINNIMFIDDLAYLSCGFGIVVVDMAKQEIKDTYYIGPNGQQINVMGLTISPEYFYAATEQGIFSADRSSSQLAFYESWSQDTTYPYRDDAVKHIQYYEGNIFACTGQEDFLHDTVFVSSIGSGQWEAFNPYENFKCYGIRESENSLLLTFSFSVSVYDKNLNREQVVFKPSNIQIYPKDSEMQNGDLWIADNVYGMVHTFQYGAAGQFITPNGPYSQTVYAMAINGNDLWVTSGGFTPQWAKLYRPYGVYHFNGTQWMNHNKTNMSAFDTISDPVSVLIDPSSQKTYIGTWGKGIMEFTGDELSNIYYLDNSSLQGIPAWSSFVAVGGMAFDSKKSLWAVNTGATDILSEMKTDGSWQSYNLGGLGSNIDVADMIIDQYDQKWVRMRADHSLLVFDENQAAGNQVKILDNRTGRGSIPGNKVYAMAEDLEGEIWIGTDEGIAVIYNPWNVFNGGSYDAQRILVEWDGYVQYLLETEVITAIAIDGNNQKWIGTDRAGVFLLSADGTEQIYHFTADDSPLFSNSIISIAINGENGEVYIATDKGIISYKGQATDGGETNEDVYAYPNPVTSGYTGPIAVKGLVENAYVKITDISGSLVYSTRAEGGQAVWNGKTMNGDDVHTGVYLVFITDEEGDETMVTKILFLN